MQYFLMLFDLETIAFQRSLWPREQVVGNPELVVFSDGSVTGFGSVAYIRWKLVTGKWWSSLVTSKSKIAPKNRITIPRIELNGAVLAKQLKEFLVRNLARFIIWLIPARSLVICISLTLNSSHLRVLESVKSKLPVPLWTDDCKTGTG